jgi:Sortase domain
MKGGTTVLGETEWRRVAGFRVVMSWPQSGYAPPPRGPGSRPPESRAPADRGPGTRAPGNYVPGSRAPGTTAAGSLRARIAGLAGVLLILGGAATIGYVIGAQQHAPQPSPAVAGAVGPPPFKVDGLSLPRSVPTSVDIPAIGVSSKLLHLGLSADGTIQVPSLYTEASEAAWFKYSATPGQIGASVIEGHLDSFQGPAVFFRLGALRPGDHVDVTLADGITAVFRVTGVREYLKSKFPAKTVYGATRYASLRLITCGGAFDYATGHYLSSTVVFASLASSHPAGGTGPGG